MTEKDPVIDEEVPKKPDADPPSDDDTSIISSDHQVNDKSYHPAATFPLYNPPKQRQRWGEKRVLPRVNWGDLFFDLFYVAASYNCSYILVDEPSPLGLLYFASTFLAVMHLWKRKTTYDACFVVEDDLYHRLFDVAFLASLASCVLSIQKVKMLSYPSKSMDMFALSLSLLIAHLADLFRHIEVKIKAVGQRETLDQVGRRGVYDAAIVILFQLIATAVAGYEYYSKSESAYRMLGEETKYEDSSYGSSANHIPIIFTLLGVIIFDAQWTIRGIFLFPSDGSHKKMMVPLNIGFVTHRYAEWTMLMVGEAVFSLLVEEALEADGYYITFYCGLTTVTLLMYSHFQSQPMEAEKHAMVKSKNRAIVSQTIQSIYTLSLVALGAAFTLFVRSFAGQGYAGRRWLEFLDELALDQRFLAGGGDSKYSQDDLNERAGIIFSIALGLVFFSLDFMSLVLHLGTEVLMKNCRTKPVCTYLVFIRGVLIAVTLSISQWTKDPEILAPIGLGCALLHNMLVTRSSHVITEDGE